jgi:hypothetical protein
MPAFDRFVDLGVERGCIAHVEHRGVAVHLDGHRGRGVGAEIVHHHRGPVGGESADERGAETRPSTGDECDLPCECPLSHAPIVGAAAGRARLVRWPR